MCLSPPDRVFRQVVYIDNEPIDLPRTFDNVRRYCGDHDISVNRVEYIFHSIHALMRVPILDEQEDFPNPRGGMMTIHEFLVEFGVGPLVVEIDQEETIEEELSISSDGWDFDNFDPGWFERTMALEADMRQYFDDDSFDWNFPIDDEEEETALINDHYYGTDEQ